MEGGGIKPAIVKEKNRMNRVLTMIGVAALCPLMAMATTEVNDNSSAAVYSVGNNPQGGSVTAWYVFHGSEDYSGDEHSSREELGGTGPFKGASVAFTFSGTTVTVLGKKGPNYGKMFYRIDNGANNTIDNYNATELDKQQIVQVSKLASGSHVLYLEVLNQKNSSASAYWQTVDAFIVDGSVLARSSGDIVPFNSSRITKSSGWQCSTNSNTDLSHGHCWSNVAGTSQTVKFTGSLALITGRPDLEDGYADIYIDGTKVGTVDGEGGTADIDALNEILLFAWKGSSGNHTLKVVVEGKHDGGATNSYVQIDQYAFFK
jgi:hypothetical protein